jgi:predicted amino acid-binding ACT domain protein
MSDNVRKVDYFHFDIRNEPSEAFHVLSTLKEHGVNLINCTAFPGRWNRAKLTVVPAEAAMLERAAQVAHVSISAKKAAFLVQGADRPGAVAEVMKKLADAKIDVTAYNATVGGTGGFGMMLWVKQKDVAAAAKALGV